MTASPSQRPVRAAVRAERVRLARERYIAACRHFDMLDAVKADKAQIAKAAFAALAEARAFIAAQQESE